MIRTAGYRERIGYFFSEKPKNVWLLLELLKNNYLRSLGRFECFFYYHFVYNLWDTANYKLHTLRKTLIYYVRFSMGR